MPKIRSSASPVIWGVDGAPRSRLYDDVYFSAAGGLAEAENVFLAGCALPTAWLERKRFCVAELGFGTGLNIVALLEAWRRTRPPGAHLSVFSIEAHPLTAEEAARALAGWPEAAPTFALLMARWPGQARGFHRIDLPELSATVDVAVMEASAGMAAWSGEADAWFLDGFAPARNRAMWKPELLGLMVRRSAPDARLATYSVAGEVRRGLTEVGFAVERRPGFGRKRQRLEARLPGMARVSATTPSVAIIGAGIAGAALARAFAALGLEARVFDVAGPGAGASGLRAALASPRLDAGLARPAALFAQAFRRATALYAQTPAAIIARGAMQLRMGPKDPHRFAVIAGSDLFEPGSMRLTDATETSALVGEPAAAGLLIEEAVVIEPERLLRAWLGQVARAGVAAVERGDGAWRLVGESGQTIGRYDVVCLAAGMASARLAGGLPLIPVRGQASLAKEVRPSIATVFGAYAVSTREGVLFGATHDRDDGDNLPREIDHQRNLKALAQGLPELAARLAGAPLEARTGVRATTGDYLPLAGAVPGAPGGLYVLSGLGSRGYTLAPLLGEHLAAVIAGAPSPLPGDLAALVDPARFARRARRRLGASAETA